MITAIIINNTHSISLNMLDYERNITQKILDLLEQFPAVAILGARQTGKTTLAKMLKPNWYYVDLENSETLALIEQEPRFFLKQRPDHLIIDEAQELPQLFKELRGIIDEDRQTKGRFLITGSSSPELLKQISESLAGRIAIVELGTLKANELNHQPLSAFYRIFNHKLSTVHLPNGKPILSQSQIHQAWLKGGYPEPNSFETNIQFQNWMTQYKETYLHRDVAKLFPNLNRIRYQRFITMLGKLSGTIINYSELARAIEVSSPTIKDYINIANGTYLWRILPSYEKQVTKAIVKMPKGHIRDTGLLHFLLKIDDTDSLYSDPIVGHSFEGFVIEEILKGLQALQINNWDAYYYRTRNGAEIDLILDGYFGTLPIEIKYGSKINFKQLRALNHFIDEHKLSYGLIINQGDNAEWVSEKVFQLPVGWL